MSRMYTTPCGVRLPVDYRQRLHFDEYCRTHCPTDETPFCYHEPTAQKCMRALIHLYRKTTPGTPAAELAPPPIVAAPGQTMLF